MTRIAIFAPLKRTTVSHSFCWTPSARLSGPLGEAYFTGIRNPDVSYQIRELGFKGAERTSRSLTGSWGEGCTLEVTRFPVASAKGTPLLGVMDSI